MIWFFTRGTAQIDVEVQRAATPGHYVLAITYPDGSERIEEFKAPERLVEKALAEQRKLIEEGWMPSSPAGRGAVVRRPAVRLTWRRRSIRLARRTVESLQETLSRFAAAVFGL